MTAKTAALVLYSVHWRRAMFRLSRWVANTGWTIFRVFIAAYKNAEADVSSIWPRPGGT